MTDDRLPYHTANHRTAILALALLVLVLVGAGGYFWSLKPTVILVMDGKTQIVRSKAPTVRDFLIEQHIPLAPLDLVNPEGSTPLSRDLSIRVTRVTTQEEKVVVDVPMSIAWKIRTSQNLRRVMIQRGFLNQRRQTVHVIFHDNKEVARQVTVQKVVRKPLYTLTLLGKNDVPEKTYNLREAKKFKMLATAYYVGDPMVPGDTTFLGHKLQRGLVAIDPTVLPLGWRLYIPGYGYAYSSDTGSAIKGLRIDLAVKNSKEEARYNHRQVTIYLLEKSKTW